MQEETPKESQQEPDQDSALQTPQPDQPHPPVTEESDYQDYDDESEDKD